MAPEALHGRRRTSWRGSTTRSFRRRTLVIEIDGQVVGDLYLALSDAWAQAEVQDRTAERRPRSAGR